MITIFRKILVLFDTILQILGRMGLRRGEKNNLSDRIRDLEDSVDDEEESRKEIV